MGKRDWFGAVNSDNWNIEIQTKFKHDLCDKGNVPKWTLSQNEELLTLLITST